MNFIFLNKCEIDDPGLREAYHVILRELEHAEELYWEDPQQCGILLRSTAERICRIYNECYELGFGAKASLKEYLCYSDDEVHNVKVSRFLSVVRKEQRDRLNKLRVLGDDCIEGKNKADQSMESEDQMIRNVKRMMETMVCALKDMCIKINGSKGLEDLRFSEEALPGKPRGQAKARPEKQSAVLRLLKNGIKYKK